MPTDKWKTLIRTHYLQVNHTHFKPLAWPSSHGFFSPLQAPIRQVDKSSMQAEVCIEAEVHSHPKWHISLQLDPCVCRALQSCSVLTFVWSVVAPFLFHWLALLFQSASYAHHNCNDSLWFLSHQGSGVFQHQFRKRKAEPWGILQEVPLKKHTNTFTVRRHPFVYEHIFTISQCKVNYNYCKGQ